MYTVYTLGEVTYVPHFDNASVFVGPGYRKGGTAYSADYLKKLGAVAGERLLWTRSAYGVVPNVIS
jgi:hypothetical protein